jgi:GMP synthase (glutamine-hydrolysing)
MTEILAVRHVEIEDLGLFAPLLEARGHTIRYLDPAREDLAALDVLAPGLLVILGGPFGANDEAERPYLTQELVRIERRLVADRPTLGICLGAQLMARALGAKVFAGPAPEIGWAGLTVNETGRGSALKHLDGAATAVMHWHGDTFDLPAGATRLASTEICANQAFSHGKAGLAVQFHPEVAEAELHRWFEAYAEDIAAAGLSLADLEADTARHGAGLRAQSARFLADWLAGQGL